MSFAKHSILAFFILFTVFSCNNKKNQKYTRFLKVSSQETNLSFNNKLTETSDLNYFNYPYIYMGGGVSVGDFNNDNLTDIYFTGNIVSNKLYLNQKGLKFKDISQTSNTSLDGIWSTGTTTVDINNDGLLDIYVSVAGKNTSFKNKLLINQGNDKNGIPIFKELAEKYGLADDGRSQQSIFFDYDNDGDLDAYVINYPITNFKTPVYFYAEMINNPLISSSNHLYRNNGNNTFTNVTKESGLLSFGLSIGVSVADLNNDGYKDIYVSNDFASPDFIYFNNKDGTFSEKSKEVTKQTSFYGMGLDIADFNNDGLLDIAQLDMSPSSHKRSKENMASMDPLNFEEIINLGLHHQYMYNTLQLNRGLKKDSLPMFSNIAAFAGVKSTDWSWAALFADFDNDGYKDLFISNGTRRDIHNKDFFNKFKKSSDNGYFGSNVIHQKDDYKIIEKMPSEPLSNYLFYNNKDLTFTDKSIEWGLGDKNFSNGAAYADFDNDGDLDLVVNNIDSEVGFYENRTNERENTNYLKIKFIGTKKNKLGIGNTVIIYTDEKLQLSELILTRGYQSSTEPILYFGLQNYTKIDSLQVQWTDGSTQKLTNITSNQTLVLNYKDAVKSTFTNPFLEKKQLFTDITSKLNIDFVHKENDYFDYNKEPLLPHKMSQFGPGLTVADVNNDGLDDFWVGGAYQQSGAIYIQQKSGKFIQTNTALLDVDKNQEDLDGLFFDADNDGNLDLYVVSGGNEFAPNSVAYQDRLYMNDGKGNFTKNKTALPQFLESGSKVIPIDFDNDGDLDLFVATRLLPQHYPKPPNSHLLENISTNTEAKFKEVHSEVFQKLGLVTDAISVDFDNDNDQDLIVVGEWMPITFLENNKGNFKNVTKNQSLKNTTGWWYSIQKADIDDDGDQDFVVGNLGKNYKYKAKVDKTFDIYANDFDNNKSLDVVLGYYEGKRQLPVRGRQCSSQQVPGIKKKFENYEKFANADLVDIYTKDKLEKGLHYKAQIFASVYIESQGKGQFKMNNLPNKAQFSSVNTILIGDFDNDKSKDILLAGNLYQSEAETPRNDASIGLLLRKTSKGLKSVSLQESGFLSDKDVKQMAFITINGKKCVLIANNNDAMQIFQINN